jgi:hypothetical protein
MVHAVATVLMMACSSATSTWAPSACAAPTRPCAAATSTRPGRRSTTPTGTTTSRPARSRPQRSKPLTIEKTMLGAVTPPRQARLERGQGQGRRSRRQDRVDGQGRGSTSCARSPPRRKAAGRRRHGAGQAAAVARKPPSRQGRRRPPAQDRGGRASSGLPSCLQGAGAHSPAGNATSPPSTKQPDAVGQPRQEVLTFRFPKGRHRKGPAFLL